MTLLCYACVVGIPSAAPWKQPGLYRARGYVRSATVTHIGQIIHRSSTDHPQISDMMQIFQGRLRVLISYGAAHHVAGWGTRIVCMIYSGMCFLGSIDALCADPVQPLDNGGRVKN